MEQVKKKMNGKQSRESRLRGLRYALILCIMMLIISAVIYDTVKSDLYEEIDYVQIEELNVMEKEIQGAIENVATHVYHLSMFPQTLRALNTDEMALYDTQESMKAISESNMCIDQLRLIDKTGNEIVRINKNNDGSAYVVSDGDLRNKSERYYFKESIEAEPSEIYLSHLDLNIEDGEVETPYNPVLRIGIQVAKESGSQGLVLLNYKAKEIFNLIDALNTHEGDEWYLVDEKGFYLHGPTEDSTFGFVVSERRDMGIFKDYSQAWSDMKQNNAGKVIEKDAWLFYKRIQPLPSSKNLVSERNWYLIMKVPHSSIRRELEHLVLGLQIGNAILIPVFILLGWTLGYSQVRNKYYKLELENQARIDPLTGLYNRRHINELLIYNTDLASRQKGDLSLVYIDLNDLKFHNDKYGHEMGDLMIQTAAGAMLDNVRKTDIVARMGGDEFMIVLPDCSIEQLNTIMKRVAATFKEEGHKRLKSPWTMSWGCSKWNNDGDTITEFINRADEEMYVNKKVYKNKEKT